MEAFILISTDKAVRPSSVMGATKRYFMTIPEAAVLTLQAGAMGRGGEIFVQYSGESIDKTRHPKIFIGKIAGVPADEEGSAGGRTRILQSAALISS